MTHLQQSTEPLKNDLCMYGKFRSSIRIGKNPFWVWSLKVNVFPDSCLRRLLGHCSSILVGASSVRQFVTLVVAIPVTNSKNNIKQVAVAL